MKKVYYSSVLLFVCLLSACNGKFDYPPTVRTLLTGGDTKEWQVEKLLERKDGALTDETKTCDLDDTFVFSKDGTLAIRDNLNRCNSDLSQTDPVVTWLLDPQDESIIYLRLLPNSSPLKTIITKLNERELELEIITDFTNNSTTIYQLKAKGLFL